MDMKKLNGRYKAVAVDGGLGESSTGKEQVAVAFKLSESGEAQGAQLTWYGYFTEATVESTHRALRACGWQGTNLAELLDFKTAIPNPAEVELVIEQEPVNDKDGIQGVDSNGNPLTRARIRWVNEAGKMALKTALAPDKAAAFAARMKGKMLALDQANKSPRTNGAPAPRQSPPRDHAKDPGEIPF